VDFWFYVPGAEQNVVQRNICIHLLLYVNLEVDFFTLRNEQKLTVSADNVAEMRRRVAW
jgi:hypothetical protein